MKQEDFDLLDIDRIKILLSRHPKILSVSMLSVTDEVALERAYTSHDVDEYLYDDPAPANEDWRDYDRFN